MRGIEVKRITGTALRLWINTGTTSLVLSSVTIHGDFALTSGTTCGNDILTAAAGCKIKVAFTPGNQGVLPTFPHPRRLRRRADFHLSRCATLTISLVQEIGQASSSAAREVVP